jgi:hypothetical protein
MAGHEDPAVPLADHEILGHGRQRVEQRRQIGDGRR